MGYISKIKVSGTAHDIKDSASVHGSGVTDVVKLTESQYAALSSKDANTLYVVVENPVVSE